MKNGFPIAETTGSPETMRQYYLSYCKKEPRTVETFRTIICNRINSSQLKQTEIAVYLGVQDAAISKMFRVRRTQKYSFDFALRAALLFGKDIFDAIFLMELSGNPITACENSIKASVLFSAFYEEYDGETRLFMANNLLKELSPEDTFLE